MRSISRHAHAFPGRGGCEPGRRPAAANEAAVTIDPGGESGAARHRHPALVGCSGWNYDSWRGRVYRPGLPPRRWLARYAELFPTVEVNATFYRLPTRSAVASWVEATPPEFVF